MRREYIEIWAPRSLEVLTISPSDAYCNCFLNDWLDMAIQTIVNFLFYFFKRASNCLENNFFPNTYYNIGTDNGMVEDLTMPYKPDNYENSKWENLAEQEQIAELIRSVSELRYLVKTLESKLEVAILPTCGLLHSLHLN